MAQRSKIPHVVHSPYHGLFGCYTLYLVKRQHPLVDPPEKNGVGMPHKRVPAQWQTIGSYGDFEQIAAVVAACPKYTQMFGEETFLYAPRRPCNVYGRVVGTLVHNKHVGVESKIAKCAHKAVCYHCGASLVVAVADQNYPHRLMNRLKGATRVLKPMFTLRMKKRTNSASRHRRRNAASSPPMPARGNSHTPMM